MSSGKGGAKPFGASSGDLAKGKSIAEVTHGVGDIKLNSTTEDDNGWEVKASKFKNKTAKQWGSQLQNPNPKPWSHNPSAARGGGRQQPPNSYRSPAAQIPPPLKNGWNWKSSTRAADESAKNEKIPDPVVVAQPESESDQDDLDSDDDDDGDLQSDDFDSDCSVKSHNTRKKSRWFKVFFETLDGLTGDQINNPERKWHCPACQNGPGAIQWYKGLQPLLSHAITKRAKRVGVHRELAELLDEEIKRRGTNVVPAGEVFGKWKGLENIKDKEIVWPPMVVIMNTRLEKDEDDKWKGMGSPELIAYFSSYDAKKAKHSYGPQGHRGMSILIFEATAVGYMEAERLSKHFEDQGTNRDAWNRKPALFASGGQRQLYGYMAEKEDLEIFNRHCPGKTKLKYDIRSYLEVVVSKMKQMSEDNQQLIWFKNRIAKEQRHSKALEETVEVFSEKLRKTAKENSIVRHRTKIHHEQNKEEMNCLEEFFSTKLEEIRLSQEAQEEKFEKLLQEQRMKVTEKNMEEEVKKFIGNQEREMNEFAKEREEMEKIQDEKRTAMKKRHLEEMLALEKECDSEFTLLIKKYTPSTTP
jgi:hypothetical protein